MVSAYTEKRYSFDRERLAGRRMAACIWAWANSGAPNPNEARIFRIERLMKPALTSCDHKATPQS